MRQLIGKLDELVLYGRTVARADALDLTAVKWRPANTLADDAGRLCRGPAEKALNLRTVDLVRHERKRSRFQVAGLRLKLRPID